VAGLDGSLTVVEEKSAGDVLVDNSIWTGVFGELVIASVFLDWFLVEVRSRRAGNTKYGRGSFCLASGHKLALGCRSCRWEYSLLGDLTMKWVCHIS